MTRTSPIRWGILGCASIAEHVAPRLASSAGCTITAIASRSEERARGFAARFPGAEGFGSYRAVLESGLVDAVYVPLPNALHAEWSIEALSRGIGVLCEKPLATSAADATRVIQASAVGGAPVMEAFMYRFHPQFDHVQRLVSEGAIGDLRTINAVFTFLLDETDSIIRSAELGGGSLLDVGCYCVDAIRSFAGMPTQVRALRVGQGVDQAFFGLMEFGRVVGRFECAIDRDERHVFELSGTDGTISFDDPWVTDDREPGVWMKRWGDEPTRIPVGVADSTERMIAGFLAAWRGGYETPISGAESLSTAVIIDELRAAAAAE